MIPGLGRSPGEGNGNPLQYSCLENPMDGGAAWARVHRVAKSWTRLSDFIFTFFLSFKPLQDLLKYLKTWSRCISSSPGKISSWRPPTCLQCNLPEAQVTPLGRDQSSPGQLLPPLQSDLHSDLDIHSLAPFKMMNLGLASQSSG